MWRELIAQLTERSEFRPPATEDDLAKEREALGGELPSQLQELLREADGVLGVYGEGLVWPVEQIVYDNLEFRSNKDFQELYMRCLFGITSRTVARG